MWQPPLNLRDDVLFACMIISAVVTGDNRLTARGRAPVSLAHAHTLPPYLAMQSAVCPVWVPGPPVTVPTAPVYRSLGGGSRARVGSGGSVKDLRTAVVSRGRQSCYVSSKPFILGVFFCESIVAGPGGRCMLSSHLALGGCNERSGDAAGN